MNNLSLSIYRNCPVSKLKTIAKNVPFNEARFCIDYHGKIYACDSFNFCHDDMIPYSEMRHHGYVYYCPEKKTYRFWTYEKFVDEVIQRLIDAGIADAGR